MFNFTKKRESDQVEVFTSQIIQELERIYDSMQTLVYLVKHTYQEIVI